MRDITFKRMELLEDGYCPLCDCSDLEWLGTFDDGDFMSKEVRCNNDKCRAKFSVGYKVVDIMLIDVGENDPDELTVIINKMEKEAESENAPNEIC
jgi:hypothetical protein